MAKPGFVLPPGVTIIGQEWPLQMEYEREVQARINEAAARTANRQPPLGSQGQQVLPGAGVNEVRSNPPAGSARQPGSVNADGYYIRPPPQNGANTRDNGVGQPPFSGPQLRHLGVRHAHLIGDHLSAEFRPDMDSTHVRQEVLPSMAHRQNPELEQSILGQGIRDAPLNDQAIPNRAPPQNLIHHKKPVFEHGDNAIEWFDEFQRYCLACNALPREIIDILLPQCLKGAHLDWYNLIKNTWGTVADFEADFKTSYFDQQLVSTLRTQAVTVRQCFNEDPCQFMIKKNLQLQRYHPHLTEALRIQTILDLVLPDYRKEIRLGKNPTTTAELFFLLTRFRAQRAQDATWETPADFSADSYVPATPSTEPRAAYVPLEMSSTKYAPNAEKSKVTKAVKPPVGYFAGHPMVLESVVAKSKTKSYTKEDAPKKHPAAHHREQASKGRPRPKEEDKKKVDYRPRVDNRPKPVDRKVAFDLSKITCYNCNEAGHYSRDCPKPRKPKTNKILAIMEQFAAQMIDVDDEEERSSSSPEESAEDSDSEGGVIVGSDSQSEN